MDPEIEARFRKARDLVAGHFESLELKIEDFQAEVRATLRQHGAIQTEHGAILKDHSGRLDDHTSRLERLDRRLDRIEVILAGMDRRLMMAVQPRFDDHERRLRRLEGAG